MKASLDRVRGQNPRTPEECKAVRDVLIADMDVYRTYAAEIETELNSFNVATETMQASALLIGWLTSPATKSGFVPAPGRGCLDYTTRLFDAGSKPALEGSGTIFPTLCTAYVDLAVQIGAPLAALRPLRKVIEKVHGAELTAPSVDLLRLCIESKAYHLALPCVDLHLKDIGSKPFHKKLLSAKHFLTFWVYAAQVCLALKYDEKAERCLLAALACPASGFSAIHVDALTLYNFCKLKSSGSMPVLPKFAPQDLDKAHAATGGKLVAEYMKLHVDGQLEPIENFLEAKQAELEGEKLLGLVKQALWKLRLQKLKGLSDVYSAVTLKEAVERAEAGLDEAQLEASLFHLITRGDINAKISKRDGSVSFAPPKSNTAALPKLVQGMEQLVGLAKQISALEMECASSQVYLERTVNFEAERPEAAVDADQADV
mmetsp:Transcript_15506/g.39237  ORF Transcript_15506/g.39237 Transcript_15506/m.39237 type:complete len:431 (+) Transcript_15506:34-1326(+)